MQFERVKIAEATPKKSGQFHQHDGKSFVSVYSLSGLTVNVPVVVDYLGSNDALKRTVPTDPATLASSTTLIGVPEAAIASLSFGWVQVYGECEAVLLEAVTSGHYLQVINTGVGFLSDGATKTVSSLAGAIDTTTAAATATIMLFGQPAHIAAAS